MSEIIERMARAHWDKMVDHPGDWDTFSGLVGADHWEVQAQIAAMRAALAAALDAMQEPSAAMIEAGAKNIWDENEAVTGDTSVWDEFHDSPRLKEVFRGFAGDAWSAMLAQFRKEALGDE